MADAWIKEKMRMTKKLSGVLVVFLAASLTVTGCFIEEDVSDVFAGNPMGNHSGMATGEAPGYEGALVKATVTLNYGYIERLDIDVSSQSEPDNYAEPMVKKLTPLFIKANSFAIDATCGATFTARAVKAAGNKALYEITAGEYGEE
jgi:uncharacterized protein with FMN-binding domain